MLKLKLKYSTTRGGCVCVCVKQFEVTKTIKTYFR